jgi:hypothetical protein
MPDDQEEIIKQLREALGNECEDISVEGEGLFFTINRKPKGNPTWHMSNNDEVIYDWKEKFSREEQGQFPPSIQENRLWCQDLLRQSQMEHTRFMLMLMDV